jgi:hypothetical protein
MQRANALKSEINQLTQGDKPYKRQIRYPRNSFLLAGEKKQKEIQTELEKIAKYFQMNLTY